MAAATKRGRRSAGATSVVALWVLLRYAVQRVKARLLTADRVRPALQRAARRAAAAMVVYGAASAGVAALIQPILDRVLPRHEELGQIIGAILVLYLIKGAGAYVSAT